MADEAEVALPPERMGPEITGEARWGHEFRYHLAGGFMARGDVVLDAACGTGYGTLFLPKHLLYLGVDREPPYEGSDCFQPQKFVRADLQTWEPPHDFDVAISFETIEHLPDVEHFIRILKGARKWIIASVPVVPTVGHNPWHVHDFAPGDLALMFEDEDWQTYQVVSQPSEFSEIAVFRRR